MAVFQTKPSQKPQKNFYAYYRKDLTQIRYKRRKPPAVTIYRGNFAPKKFTGKEQDQETGLYYFGARYLDPKTSRWLSTDPALGDYLPVAPNGDDAKKHNQNLPGMGGVFNVINLHVYHYAGNNPVKLVDPDGRMQKNEDGNLIFEPKGELQLYGHKSDIEKEAKMQDGTLFADDGTPIKASSNREVSEPGFDTNCHGYTFADGKYWVDPDQVPNILSGDHYRHVNDNDVKVGDVVIYHDINMNYAHSAKVVGVTKQFRIFGLQFGKIKSIEVEGIGGIKTEVERKPVEEGWRGATHHHYVRKRQ